MKKQDFDNLVTSIKQAGKIRRREMKAIRMTFIVVSRFVVRIGGR